MMLDESHTSKATLAKGSKASLAEGSLRRPATFEELTPEKLRQSQLFNDDWKIQEENHWILYFAWEAQQRLEKRMKGQEGDEDSCLVFSAQEKLRLEVVQGLLAGSDELAEYVNERYLDHGDVLSLQIKDVGDRAKDMAGERVDLGLQDEPNLTPPGALQEMRPTGAMEEMD
ncbi:hypothetical protein C8J56DRAFT_1044697 [Mycena floridula]|nr:hypothetical protein C8J56DRAFT_1044697 [Mycena floridula]